MRGARNNRFTNVEHGLWCGEHVGKARLLDRNDAQSAANGALLKHTILIIESLSKLSGFADHAIGPKPKKRKDGSKHGNANQSIEANQK
jgi:hypothetical protein